MSIMLPPLSPSGATRWVALGILLIISSLALRAKPVTVPEIRAHLLQWEGYSLTPYRDGPGWAAGIGHSLTSNMEPVRARYTAAQVERWFWADVSWGLDACRAGVTRFDDLPREVQLLTLGVCLTVGRTGFARMTAFRLSLSSRQYRSAASALQRYSWAAQVGPARTHAYVTTLRTATSP